MEAFFYSDDVGGQYTIQCFNVSSDNTYFDWLLTLACFEAVYGFSRILLLLPDKLATALTIASEEEEGEGAWLITLVVNLLKRYIDSYVCVNYEPNQRVNPDTRRISLKSQIIQDRWRPFTGFRDTLKAVESELEILIHLLNLKKFDEYQSRLPDFIDFCDELFYACQAYLQLAHPFWIRTNRSHLFDPELLREIVRRFHHSTRIRGNISRLRDELAQLIPLPASLPSLFLQDAAIFDDEFDFDFNL